MDTSPTVLSSLPKILVEALSSYQVDVPGLLREAGVDRAELESPGARIPFATTQRLWSACLAATGDPCIGLVAAQFAHPTDFHALGFAWLASPTLGGMLKRLVRYERLLLNMPWASLEERAERTAVRLTIQGDGPEVAACRTDGAFAVLMRWFVGLTEGDFAPELVEFRHDDRGQRWRYEETFGAALRFGAEADRFWLGNTVLERTLRGQNAALAAEADRIAERYLAALSDRPTARRVRQLLLDLLPQGEADLDGIASRLHMSPRSLQRHLGDEGHSFRGLLEETRKALAVTYVRQQKQPLVEVAFRLGFSDQSSFSKAFKRWTGLSPAAFAAAGRPQ